MQMTMVRYTVKADRLEEHLKLAAAVYDELSQTKPSGLHYATFRGTNQSNMVDNEVRGQLGESSFQFYERRRTKQELDVPAHAFDALGKAFKIR